MRCLRDTLAAELPPGSPETDGVRWNDPDGRLLPHLDVPFEADEAALDVSAEKYGVIWTPMRTSTWTTRATGRSGSRAAI